MAEKYYLVTVKNKAFRGAHNLWVKSSLTDYPVTCNDERTIESQIAWMKNDCRMDVISYREVNKDDCKIRTAYHN